MIAAENKAKDEKRCSISPQRLQRKMSMAAQVYRRKRREREEERFIDVDAHLHIGTFASLTSIADGRTDRQTDRQEKKRGGGRGGGKCTEGAKKKMSGGGAANVYGWWCVVTSGFGDGVGRRVCVQLKQLCPRLLFPI